MSTNQDKLKIRPELLSITAINPFSIYNSSPRLIMLASHIGQHLQIKGSSEKIIQSGIEREMGKTTFAKKFDNDARIISVVSRYRSGVELDSIDKVAELIVIYEDLEERQIKYLDIPIASNMHQYFGFKYKWDTELLNNMSFNDILPAGTIVADSHAVKDENGYGFGVELNVAMMSLPEVAEDGIIISDEALPKLGIEIFEKRTIEFGSESFPLNLYGEGDEYKPFPEIGEVVHPSGAIMALRDYNDDLSPALLSEKDAREFNPMFDKVTYTRGPGGVVVDIKVIHSPKFKKEVYSKTGDLAKKYANGLIRYYKDLINVYDNIVADHKARYGDSEVVIDPAFSRLLIDAYAYVNSSSTEKGGDKIKKVFRKEELDIYKIEFTIQYDLIPNIGYKITGLSGDKAVMCEIRKAADMPVDKNGVRADVVVAPDGTIGRMNIGRLYDNYITGAVRKVKQMVINNAIMLSGVSDPLEALDILDDRAIDVLMSDPLNFLFILGTAQYKAYDSLTSREDKIIVLTEIIEKEFYVFYSVDAVVKAPKIVELLLASPYAPLIDKVSFNTDRGPKVSKEDILIAPLYMMLLCKIADTWLSTPSAKINHFGLPIGVSKTDKNRLPWRNSPVRILSETETRLFGAYAGREALIELKDRANSITTHEHVYRNILTADKPTNIEKIVNRKVQPFGTDKTLEVVNAIFNCSGVEIAYLPDSHPEYEYDGNLTEDIMELHYDETKEEIKENDD